MSRPRRSGVTSRSWSSRGSSTASTVAPCRPTPSRCSSSAVSERDRHGRRAEGPDRQGRPRPAPRATAASSCSTPGRRRGGWPRSSRPTVALTLFTNTPVDRDRQVSAGPSQRRGAPARRPGSPHHARRRSARRRWRRCTTSGSTSASSARTASPCEHGLTTPDADEAAVKSAMIAAGHRVVVLTDSRKFGHETPGPLRHLRPDRRRRDRRRDPRRDDVTALEALDIDVVIA